MATYDFRSDPTVQKLYARRDEVLANLAEIDGQLRDAIQAAADRAIADLGVSKGPGVTAPRQSNGARRPVQRKAVSRPKQAEGFKRPAAKAVRTRRTADDLNGVIEQIVETLQGRKEGMRTEELRGKLGLERSEITRPISMALGAKRITKRGEKRATTYFAK